MKTINSNERKISFTCNKDAAPELIKLLSYLEMLGLLGCTRDIVIDGDNKWFVFDGDGPDRISDITINGVSVGEWEEDKAPMKMEMDE